MGKYEITVGRNKIVHKKDGSTEITRPDGTVEVTPAPTQEGTK